MSKTSIVLLTYNNLDYTKICIDSIRRFTEKGTYEIIVVDNMSTDGTRDWLAEQTDVLTIFNEENVGFPKGCNQGIRASNGDYILLMNNDTVATYNWLPLLVECLDSSKDIGAVGPITNSAYGYQEMKISYSTLEEMWEFAQEHNRADSSLWEERLKLIGFCLLIKKSVIDEIGVLDERFTPGMCEDSDFCVRVMKAGYKNVLCNNVFIHHFGSTSWNEMPEKTWKLLSANRKKFQEKWGFQTTIDMDINQHVVRILKDMKTDTSLKILDVKSRCGGTLLKIKSMFPDCELHGFEENTDAAEVSSRFADISVGSVEDEELINSIHDKFDVIIVSNVLEQWRNPSATLSNLFKMLKPSGTLIVEFNNASHISNISQLLIGNRNQSSSRFTSAEVQEMLISIGLTNLKIYPIVRGLDGQEKSLYDQLSRIQLIQDHERFKSIKYIIKARSPYRKGIAELLIQFDQGIDQNVTMQEIVNLVRTKTTDRQEIIDIVNQKIERKQFLYNQLARQLFREQLYEDIIPILHASLLINIEDADTLFNYAFILLKIGAYDQAFQIANKIQSKDAETLELLEEIEERRKEATR